MSGQLPAIADLAVIIAILCGPTLTGWFRNRRAMRSHPWDCDCDERLTQGRLSVRRALRHLEADARERRQEARQRHPAGTGMDEQDAAWWDELAPDLAAWKALDTEMHWRRVDDILGAPYAADYDPDQEAP